MRDKVAKGRQATGARITANRVERHFENHPASKLTFAKAAEIRRIANARMKPGNRYGRKQLAEQFKVSESLIKKVVSQGWWA